MASRFERNLVAIRGVTAEIRQIGASGTAPTGAMFSPYGFINTGYPQTDQFEAISSIEGAYLAEMYTFRCIETITRAICAQPFRMGSDPVHKKSFDKNHPLAKLIGKDSNGQPNPFWASTTLLKYALAQYLLTGKWAWEYGTAGDGSLELWPLMVQALKPIPGSPTANQYFTGFDYGQRGTANYRQLHPDQLAYFWKPSLADVRQPETVMQAGQINVSVLRMINMYDHQFLKNNATPSTLIITPPFAEPEERRAFQDQFVAEFGGYSNAGRTMFMETEDSDAPGNGVANPGASTSVQRIAATSKEAEMRILTNDMKNDIAAMWGVPRSVMGDSSDKNVNVAGTDRKNFWIDTCAPIADEFADQVNTVLAPRFGSERGWFDLSSVRELQPDTFITGINLVDLIANHIVTRDEARHEMGYSDWADVDPANTPFGVQPSDPGIATASKTNPIAKVYEDVPGSDGTDVGVPVAPAKASPAPVELPKPSARANTDMLAAARLRREHRHAGPEGHQHVPSGHVTPSVIGQMLQTSMDKLLADQQLEATRRLTGQRGARRAREARESAPALFDADYWEPKVIAAIAPAVGERAAVMANRYITDTLSALASIQLTPDSASTVLAQQIAALTNDLSLGETA